MARRRSETPSEARARRAAVDDPAAVLDAAARFLEVRPRSIAEVRRRLRDNGYREDLVEGAIARLVDLGMLDDAAFARAWVESRDRARPRGARALQVELRRKGVAEDLIALALGERQTTVPDGASPGSTGAAGATPPDEAADRAAAERLLARRGSALLREPDVRRRRSKAYALLARSGFGPEVCREAVNAWLADLEPDPAE
jgi:regulatory protein